jgi:hypothetical protein
MPPRRPWRLLRAGGMGTRWSMCARLIGGLMAFGATGLGQAESIRPAHYLKCMWVAIVALQGMVRRRMTVHATGMLQHTIHVHERLR